MILVKEEEQQPSEYQTTKDSDLAGIKVWITSPEKDVTSQGGIRQWGKYKSLVEGGSCNYWLRS